MGHYLNIGIVLLAAGSSSRMGRNKLGLIIGDETILHKIIRSAQGSFAGNVVLVLGANYRENEKQIGQLAVEIIVNSDWNKGIGSSIKQGLKKILTVNPKLEAVIISVCDQPFLSSELFNSLMEKYRETGKPIVASAYAGSVGVPVLYDKTRFEELAAIPDQYGAKKHILEKVNNNMLTTVPFPKGKLDIDTPEDVKLLDEKLTFSK